MGRGAAAGRGPGPARESGRATAQASGPGPVAAPAAALSAGSGIEPPQLLREVKR